MNISTSLPLISVEENSSTGPILLITQLSRLISRRSTPELLGQTLKEVAVLAYLREYQEPTQQQLTEGLCIDTNYCVMLLNDLEASGLVERRRDPTDRRRHIVTMTEQGRKALHQAEAAQQTLEDEILGALDSTERSELSHLMRKAIKGQSTHS
jgi:DNA-binding MarR family transcriptional regulator